MEKFNVGDWVYGSDWCYGVITDIITDIKGDFADVEYETDRGGGSCSFLLEDLKKAEPPKRNALETLPQYHFNRNDFCRVMFDVFTSEEYVDLDVECGCNTHLDNFTLMRVEDEFYILHRDSGILINWYKHAGRTNTCNKPDFTLDDFREFLVELRKDLVWNDIIKDEELKKKMLEEQYG